MIASGVGARSDVELRLPADGAYAAVLAPADKDRWIARVTRSQPSMNCCSMPLLRRQR